VARTPEETVRRLQELLLAKDMDGIADLWAPDGVAEFPFATAGAPTRLDGREEVRRYLAGYPERMDVTAVPPATVHHTNDPDTIVVEFTAHGRTVRTDTPYRMDYIAVVTVTDGLIIRYRDYWSPVAAAIAAGTLPELLAALGATTGAGARA
jgi:uncharacterized protein